jgi:hypothetical protein
MTANPLMSPRNFGHSKSLEEHCETLNKMNWVRGSGFRYFVREKPNADGEVERFIDRMDVVQA